MIRTLAALAFLALLAGGAVLGFGLYNVSARAGHWPITVWVLHTIYRPIGVPWTCARRRPARRPH